MKSEAIKQLFNRFESAVIKFEGVESWSARNLQDHLGYGSWEEFEQVIDKAKEAFLNAGEAVESHFYEVTRVIGLEEVDDFLLTRPACYLVAQNGDSRKEKVAFAQSYFAIQTRRAELVEQRLLEHERVQAREKLGQTERRLSGILYERGVDSQGFGTIRSKGDLALFKNSTQTLKWKLGIPNNRPVADFLPTISIKAKDLAAEMTGINVQVKDLSGQSPIEKEHVDNNTAVRKMLIDRGIVPESLPAVEDVKKVQRKFQADERKVLTEKLR
jgi:DNA-damage-inducible protein D